MFQQSSGAFTASTGGGAPSTASSASTGFFGEMGRGARRATVSLSDLRTPLVENIMSMLPMGHDKALKYALYNVLALILTAVCIVAFWAAYCILEPFIVPLLWALLCGSVIHPFKDRLVSFTKEWIVMVKASTAPLSVQLVCIPFRAIDSVSESIGSRVASYWWHIGTGCVMFFVTYLFYHNPPYPVGLMLYWIAAFTINAFLWIVSWNSWQVVCTLTVAYLAIILHFVYGVGAVPHQAALETQQQNKETTEDAPEKEKVEETTDKPHSPSQKETDTVDKRHPDQDWEKLILRTLSVTAWFSWFIYLCHFLPYPLLLLVIISLAVGSVVFLRKHSFREPVTKLAAFTTIKGLLAGGDTKSRRNSRRMSRKGSMIQLACRKNAHGVRTPSPAETSSIPSSSSIPSTSSTPLTSERQSSVGDSLIEHVNVSQSSSLIDTPTLSMKARRTGLDLNIPPEQEESSSTIIQDEPEDSTSSTLCEDEVDGLLDSSKFLYGVFCACLIVQLWNRLWLVHLLPIPVVYYGVKRACISFGIHDYLHKLIYEPVQNFYLTKGTNSRNVFPQPVRAFVGILYEADKKIISVFESYLDMVATIIILVAVVVVSVIFMIFVATQFYAEGDHLVRVGANVINSTVSQYPEISQLLPEGWESLTGSLVGKAYHYGRDYIKTMIRDSVAERNPEKAEEMEKQVIELWDRIYINWNRTWDHMDNVGGKVPQEGVGWDDIVKTGQNWFDTNMLVAYAKANYGQVLAVLESLWTVLIGNVSLAISAITSVFSVLFGGGSALLNLIINFVVFFTALFYLLSSSTSVYKPVQIFNSWLPGDGKRSSHFVFAIEESVSGVFSATIKMSVFYGMWTWLIHTLFQVNIVFVPSFFAAIFAAVPLLMPYWAAFPAVLELWLIQGQWTKALFMLLAQMAPMSLVDAQIYSEIKGGGHPYLTALAVAGGIFYFGFQGAIVGPVVLCFLFVAAKLGSSYMKEGGLDG